jgi:hypothetical protein
MLGVIYLPPPVADIRHPKAVAGTRVKAIACKSERTMPEKCTMPETAVMPEKHRLPPSTAF